VQLDRKRVESAFVGDGSGLGSLRQRKARPRRLWRKGRFYPLVHRPFQGTDDVPGDVERHELEMRVERGRPGRLKRQRQLVHRVREPDVAEAELQEIPDAVQIATVDAPDAHLGRCLRRERAFFRGGGAFAFKGGVPGFGGGWRFRGYRYGLLRYGAGAGYGVIASGGGAAADAPVTYVQVNNQIPRDGFDRTVQRVCRAETYTVPSESGGTRDVMVTRCFKE